MRRSCGSRGRQVITAPDAGAIPRGTLDWRPTPHSAMLISTGMSLRRSQQWHWNRHTEPTPRHSATPSTTTSRRKCADVAGNCPRRDTRTTLNFHAVWPLTTTGALAPAWLPRCRTLPAPVCVRMRKSDDAVHMVLSRNSESNQLSKLCCQRKVDTR